MQGIGHIPKLNHLRHVINILSCLTHVKLLSEGHRTDTLRLAWLASSQPSSASKP
jgi:hypothetical protein